MDPLRRTSRVPCSCRPDSRRRVAAATLIFLALPALARAQRKAMITGTCTLNGHVLSDQGAAVGNAMVRLQTAEGVNVEQSSATTAGQFFFSGIPKGEYFLIVNAEGFETYRQPVNMADGPLGAQTEARRTRSSTWA